MCRHHWRRLLSPSANPVVRRCGVWIDTNSGGIDVDDGVRQVWDVVEKLVVGDFGNLVRFCDR
jgi:hypothetical protein